MKKIAIYCEKDFEANVLTDVSYELISKAYSLKERARVLLKNYDYNYIIDAVVLADSIDDESIQKAYSAGADRIILIQSETFRYFDSIVYSKAFVEYYDAARYDCVLFPATTKTRMVAPRITTILDTGLVADCTDIDFVLKDKELKLAPTRPTFGSELMATILSKKNPQCATIRPKTFEAVFNSDKKGELVQYCVNAQRELNIEVLSSVIKEKNEKSYFKDAKIVFACGYGISGNGGEYYRKVQWLAQKYNAKIASTRKVVGFGYLPQETQIGQTGSTVNADLYIAFGINGAIQHICGMKNCKTIVAINTDTNADIFKYSDYKIVDDAKKIIDELMKLL